MNSIVDEQALDTSTLEEAERLLGLLYSQGGGDAGTPRDRDDADQADELSASMSGGAPGGQRPGDTCSPAWDDELELSTDEARKAQEAEAKRRRVLKDDEGFAASELLAMVDEGYDDLDPAKDLWCSDEEDSGLWGAADPSEGLFVDAETGELLDEQILQTTLSKRREIWYMPDAVAELYRKGDVERWQRTRERYDREFVDRYIETDGAFWYVDHSVDKPDPTDPWQRRPFNGLPEQLKPATCLTPDKIPYGMPGYWVHFKRGPRIGEAIPVYGYMLDMGRRTAGPPHVKDWQHQGWDTCEYLVRCASCGRELPPKAYRYFKDQTFVSMCCRDCLNAARYAEDIDSRRRAGQAVSLREWSYLRNYKMCLVLWWRKGYSPRGKIAREVIGEHKVYQRCCKASLYRSEFDDDGPRDDRHHKFGFATKEEFIATSSKDTVKSRPSIRHLFADVHQDTDCTP